MKKSIVKSLIEKAKDVGRHFSDPERLKNTNQEIFELHEIIPLSEYTAAVIYIKNTTKKGVAFFYYIQSGSGYWTYFFPTDSHIIGMESFGRIKQKIESENFDKNE